ncbi:uncharacterized protein LOC131024805 [Salvia miltiorrhiza]|uniref:uncharacterized protein LOC131024805 n=1 Tax=Salvia miltiorrhiza TaxID=226208 RepID=UPI0025AB620E|nr:uncharacterized protein LOC131024805 [Salvia miltiorrhiza]
MSNPNTIELIRQILSNPQFQAALATISVPENQAVPPLPSLPAPMTTPETASRQAPPPVSQTPEVSKAVLNPAPISTIEHSADSPVEKPAKQGEPEKPSIKRKKKGAETSRPKLKAVRRSNRIPTQPRVSKPGPPKMVLLDESEDDAPPAKQARTSGPTVETSTADEESAAPTEETAEPTAPSPAQSLDTLLNEAEAEVAAENPSDDDTLLTEVLTKLKRKAIREGKRKATTSAVPPTPEATESEEEDMDVEDEEPEGSDMEADKAYQPFFYTADAAKSWQNVKKMECYSERNIEQDSFKVLNLVEFFKSRHLFKSVTEVEPFVKAVVQLVYSNLTADFGNPKSRKYGKAFYRNTVFNLTPSVINGILGTPDVKPTAVKNMDKVASVITGGKVRKWLKPMKSSTLSYLYSALFKIMTMNWIVSTNSTVVTQQHGILLYCIGEGLPFNLGQVIFDQIAASSQLSGLPFPSLIFRALRSQGVQVKASAKREIIHEYALTSMLFSEGKVADLPWVNPVAAPSVEDTTMITIPKATLQALLQHIDELENSLLQARRIQGESSSILNKAKGQLTALLSSQKGGEDAAADAAEGTGERRSHQGGEVVGPSQEMMEDVKDEGGKEGTNSVEKRKEQVEIKRERKERVAAPKIKEEVD